MFCYKCGSNVSDDTSFCANCGASLQAAQQPAAQYTAAQRPDMPMEQAYPQQGSAANQKKSRLWPKIAVPVALAVIAAAAAYFFIFLNTPSAQAAKVVANLRSEMTQRMDTTPLQIFSKLSEIMDDGTLTIDFDYENKWFDTQSNGSITFASKAKEREFAVAGDVSVAGSKANLEAYVNKERVALGSRLVDNNYYGFKFDTFRDDFKAFGDTLGLDRTERNRISDTVEMIGDALNSQPRSKDSKDGASDGYAKLMEKFIENCEQSSTKAEIESGGKNVKATKIEYVVTKNALFGLLDDLLDMFESDDSYIEQFSMFSMYFAGMMDFSDMLNQIRNQITMLEDSYSSSSTITISFYIGSNNRLLRIELDASLKIEDQKSKFSGSFDFGASATDRWEIKLSNGNDTIKIVWDCNDNSGTLENTIKATAGGETIKFVSKWTPEKGNFTLSFSGDSGYSGELTGNLKIDKTGFKLTFKDLMEGNNDESLSLNIKAEAGADIKQVNYINIDKWDEALLEKLESAFNVR